MIRNHRLTIALVVLSIAVFGWIAPAKAVDCYPPGSCESAPTSSYRSIPGSSLTVGSISAAYCVGKTCSPTTAVRTVASGEIKIGVPGGSAVRIRPVSADGRPVQVGADGTLSIPVGGGVSIALSGMMPGTYVDVFINSNRVFLGRVLVAPDGTATATLPMPKSVGVGFHTAQVVATVKSGKVLNSALGVLVNSPKLLKSKPRYVIYDAVPRRGGRVELLTSVNLSVRMVDLRDGVLLKGAKATSLPKCTVRVSVTAANGRVLLPSSCMRNGGSGGTSASLSWTVPTGYQGKATVVFEARESGRPSYRLSRQVDVLG